MDLKAETNMRALLKILFVLGLSVTPDLGCPTATCSQLKLMKDEIKLEIWSLGFTFHIPLFSNLMYSQFYVSLTQVRVI